MVLKTELKPTNADCEEFLNKLWTMRRLDDEYPLDEIRLKRLAEIYILAHEDLGDPTGVHKFRMGHCHLLLNNFEVAYCCLTLSLEIQQTILPQLDLRLAKTYLEAGLANLSRQRRPIDLKTARECILKAVEIYEKTTADSAYLAEAYVAKALLFEKLDDCIEAARLTEKALTIFEITSPKNKCKLARTHENLGRYLMKIKRYDEALVHLQIAATILERLSPENLNIALAYRAIGELHKFAGNLDRAFHYTEKAIKILEKMYPKNFSEIGKLYAFVAELYELLGRQKCDISYLQKSSETYQFALQMMYQSNMFAKEIFLIECTKEYNDNNRIVGQYRRKANCCRKNKRYDEAEKYILAALKEIVPEKTEPMEICHTYLSAMKLYTDMKNFNRALDYAHCTLVAYSKAFPDNEENFLETLHLSIRDIHDCINLDNS